MKISFFLFFGGLRLNSRCNFFPEGSETKSRRGITFDILFFFFPFVSASEPILISRVFSPDVVIFFPLYCSSVFWVWFFSLWICFLYSWVLTLRSVFMFINALLACLIAIFFCFFPILLFFSVFSPLFHSSSSIRKPPFSIMREYNRHNSYFKSSGLGAVSFCFFSFILFDMCFGYFFFGKSGLGCVRKSL